MTIFEALRQSHDQQRQWCEQIVQTQGDSPERRQLHQDLIKELKAHAQAEDRYFYVPLMFDDVGLNITRHALSEHHDMDELIESIAALDYSNPHWLIKIKALAEVVLHHLDEEEHGFFQQAGKILSAKQKTDLAEQYFKEYQKALKSL